MKEITKLIKKYASIIKYAFFGGLTTIINIVTYHFCSKSCNLNNVSSTLIAWIVAVSFAFVTNKMYVFNSKSWNKNTLREVTEFFVFRILVGGIELVLMIVFVDILHLNGTLMKLVTNVVAIILNYFASNLIVFKKRQSQS